MDGDSEFSLIVSALEAGDGERPTALMTNFGPAMTPVIDGLAERLFDEHHLAARLEDEADELVRAALVNCAFAAAREMTLAFEVWLRELGNDVRFTLDLPGDQLDALADGGDL